MSWTLPDSLLKEHLSDVFFETGTHLGGGITLAVSVGFKEIYSIDINQQLVSSAQEKFKDNENIHIFQGSSASLLFDICSSISSDKKITFWLDGHYHNSTDNDDNNFPILRELEQIAKLPSNTHTILIDDVRLFGGLLKHTKEMVEEKVLEVNPSYKIQYADSKVARGDILVATV